MTPRLARAQYVHEYKIRVTFEDGREGIIDIEDELWGEVFEPLKDTEVFRGFRVSTGSWTRSCGPPAPIFRGFRVDRELDTIVWSTRRRSGAGVSLRARGA